VEAIFECTPSVRHLHGPDSPLYAPFDRIIRAYFAGHGGDVLEVAPLEGVVWPRVGLGNVSTYDFFSFDSFIMFSFYVVNRKRYETVFDVGANLGLHSILLSRLGCDVHAFEPDPVHHELLVRNLAANGCHAARVYRKAVSNRTGLADFVRVMGNTTASHITGARGFYGEVEHFSVETVAFDDIAVEPDLMKIDIEGHERNVILAIEHRRWVAMDAMVEVHSERNSEAIFEYFRGSGINVFVQKLGWRKAERVADMPRSNREGNIFITSKPEMSWGAGT
jgi:FkbM family methyltransferase